MKDYYRSGELARLCGVSTDTLRHYERLGLTPRPRRSPNGYREYAIETLDRVRIIQAALSLGFTLAELSRILRIRDKGGVPCREVRDLARVKVQQLDSQIRQMKRLSLRLRNLIRNWDERLEHTGPGIRAGLLETLKDASSAGSHQRQKTKFKEKNK